MHEISGPNRRGQGVDVRANMPEQLHGDPERHERGPLRLRIRHLGGDVLGEQPSQRAEAAAARGALAGTARQPRTDHRHLAERRTELERGPALAPRTPGACATVSVVRRERRGCGHRRARRRGPMSEGDEAPAGEASHSNVVEAGLGIAPGPARQRGITRRTPCPPGQPHALAECAAQPQRRREHGPERTL